MSFLSMNLFFLQQADASSGSPFNHLLVLMAIWFFVIWFIAIRPQRKAEQARQQKMNQLKKNDHVVTIGGMIGIVDSVSPEEVVLKVDEKNNVKIRFLKSAIHRLLEDKKEGPVEKKDDKKDEKASE